MSNFMRKLSSRKLWLALAGVATGIALILGVDGGDVTTVAGALTSLASVITYIVTEGKIDANGVKNAVEATQDAIKEIVSEEE